MATTLQDLRNKFRTEIKTDQSGKIWADSELNDLANAAYLQAQVDGQFNWPANQGTSSTQALTGGTQEYALPSDFGRLELATITQGSSVTPLSAIDFVGAKLRNLTSSQSTPSSYYIRGSNIGFDPIPDSSGTVSLYYRKILTTLSGDTDAISFPDSFMLPLIQYMAYLAWSGPRGNEQAAQSHFANYKASIARLMLAFQLRDNATLNYMVQRDDFHGQYPKRIPYYQGQ